MVHPTATFISVQRTVHSQSLSCTVTRNLSDAVGRDREHVELARAKSIEVIRVVPVNPSKGVPSSAFRHGRIPAHATGEPARNVSDVEITLYADSSGPTMPKPNLCRIIIHGKRHSREFVFESSQRIALFLSLTIAVNQRVARNEACE
jgi:hypothetical protein